MGYYINPVGIEKEEWLILHGNLIDPHSKIEEDERIVCLIDNGPFTAAGICYDDRELKEFRDDPTDTRHKLFFVVKNKDLIDVCPEVKDRLEG